MEFQPIWFLLLGALLLGLGALGGIMVERRRLGFVIRDQAARNVEMSRRITDLERIQSEAVRENQDLASFLVVLPDVVRRLNSKMSKRDVPSLLTSTLEHLFEPATCLIYVTSGKEELVLAHAKGAPAGLAPGARVRFGDGKVGLAARHQMVMNREDILSDSVFRRSSVESTDAGPDLIAPMAYEGKTLGVIAIAGCGKKHKDEKRMLKLVADIGSLALTNLDLFASLQNIANRDSLTNLSTKRFLNMALGKLTHQAEQTHTPLSIIIFDIDHFKKFNDTYGHPAGDEILRTVAALIRRHLRAEDIPARYGGEEFVVVLPNTSKEDALRKAETIRLAIEKYPFVVGKGNPAKPGAVTISGGVASLQVDGRGSQEILSAADQALYLAKGQGRNRVVPFHARYLSDDEEEVEAGAL